MKLSKMQIELMKRTVGETNSNFFAIHDSSKYIKDFEYLVEVGFAIKEKPHSWSDTIEGVMIYLLTKKGKDFLKEIEGI